MINKQINYYYIDNSKKGPYKIDELVNEPIIACTLIWYEDLMDWKELRQIPEIYDYIKSNKEHTQSKKTIFIILGIVFSILVVGSVIVYKNPNIISSGGIEQSSNLMLIKKQLIALSEYVSNNDANGLLSFIYSKNYTSVDFEKYLPFSFSAFKVLGGSISIDKETIEIISNSDVIVADNHKFIIVTDKSLGNIEVDKKSYMSSFLVIAFKKLNLPEVKILNINESPEKTTFKKEVQECNVWVYDEEVQNWLVLPITPEYYPEEVKAVFYSKCPCNTQVSQPEQNNNSGLILLQEMLKQSEQKTNSNQSNINNNTLDNETIEWLKRVHNFYPDIWISDSFKIVNGNMELILPSFEEEIKVGCIGYQVIVYPDEKKLSFSYSYGKMANCEGVNEEGNNIIRESESYGIDGPTGKIEKYIDSIQVAM